MYKYLTIIAMAIVFSTAAEASGGYGHPGRGHAYGHHKHHHHGYYAGPRYFPRPVERVYYREEIRYVPQPPIQYQRPYAAYPAPRYDNRSVEGRLGAAFGGVVGYEVGRGDPLAAGLGAAVGTVIGNEIRR